MGTSQDFTVAILNTSDIAGGAARAAHRLHRGLTQLGVESTYFVRDARGGKGKIVATGIGNETARQLDVLIYEHYINANRTDISETYFSSSFYGPSKFDPDRLASFSVINLHWVEEFVSLGILQKIVALGKPIIWTIHDAKPFTGGCHYPAGCEGFVHDCANCIQLKNDPHCLTQHVLAAKKAIFRHVQPVVVSPSKWLACEARRSALFGDQRIEVIPNSIDTDIFRRLDKNQLRTKYGIPADAVVLKFGSCNNREKRKGFRYLHEAVSRSLEHERFRALRDKGQLMVLTTGLPDDSLSELQIPVKSMGYVGDEALVAELYALSDIFLLPSLEDNLPNTMLEAMACGVPVVGFKTGGIPDLVDNECGRVVKQKDAEAMASSIVDLVLDAEKRSALGEKAQQKIQKGYTLAHQAAAYRTLFEGLVADTALPSPQPVAVDLDFFDAVVGRSVTASMERNETVSVSKKQLDDMRREIQELQSGMHALRSSIEKMISCSKYTQLGKKIKAYKELVSLYNEMCS